MIEIENYVYENFKKNKNKILKMLFPLPETPVFTDEELIKFMNEAVDKINKDMITPKILKKAIKLLREYKVPEPYYIKVENPVEGGDPLYHQITQSPFCRDSVGTEELHEDTR